MLPSQILAYLSGLSGRFENWLVNTNYTSLGLQDKILYRMSWLGFIAASIFFLLRIADWWIGILTAIFSHNVFYGMIGVVAPIVVFVSFVWGIINHSDQNDKNKQENDKNNLKIETAE